VIAGALFAALLGASSVPLSSLDVLLLVVGFVCLVSTGVILQPRAPARLT
jgi:hypothetical protein